MHILSGRFRGRRLESPPGHSSRPTLSRIRQALFNILRPGLAGVRFLDFYAGAGSIGLEALSEGAARVTLAESDRTILQTLQANVRALDPEGRAVEILAMDAAQAARQLLRQGKSYEFIFLDPPYRLGAASVWAQEPALVGLLAPGGFVIYQHGVREDLPALWAGLARTDLRQYGKTKLAFYQRPAGDAEAGSEPR